MDTLTNTVMQAMTGYAVNGLNGYSVLTTTADQRMLTVVSVAEVHGKRIISVSLMVRLENDMAVIDHDVNNKPLVDALVQAGVPRERIVLAYAGEAVPERA
jgi:hypothetical protein